MRLSAPQRDRRGSPAWEKHHKEGKTDEITGRFFGPRVSEEFYDTVNEFDNVHNLIDDPTHQKKIVEMRRAMRKKQLELYDSGLLPESMRVRWAQQHNMTIYEMVRNAELYPLGSYLDATDVALEGNPRNRSAMIKGMSDPDSGIRYWAVVGLHLLEDEATPAVETLEQALKDECDEVKIMSVSRAAKQRGKCSNESSRFALVKAVPDRGEVIVRGVAA